MITVTGASGHVGRLVIESLLERGVPASDLRALARTPEKVADLADRGVEVRYADYSKPETLPAALEGTGRLLLVSGSELGRRVPQHRNTIDAAVAAGVEFIAYTSIPKADAVDHPLIPEHRATEEAIKESGLPHALLRNSWYLENYTERLGETLQHGAIFGSAGDGRVSAASRADYAAAAAAVLTAPVEGKAIYELGGDTAFTMSELAAEISSQSGTTVIYNDLPEADYVQLLVGVGVPQPAADVYAGADAGVSRGELFVDSGHLRHLIGRPSTTLTDAIAAGLAALPAPA